MVHFILFIIAITLTVLFFFLSNYALKRSLNYTKEKKVSGCLQQIILRILILGIGLGLIFFIRRIQKIVFIMPQNGYDLEPTGANLFAAIGLIMIIFSLLSCLDYILFPRNAGKKTGNPRNFHLGFKLRPKLMTAIFFVSICLVLLNMLSYSYYKPGGEIVISEERGLETTHYNKSDIKEVTINSYRGGKGGTFTELIITFSDGRVLTANDDSAGARKLLSEWQGDVRKTNDNE